MFERAGSGCGGDGGGRSSTLTSHTPTKPPVLYFHNEEGSGRIRKDQEGSGRIRKDQEGSGRIRKDQEG